MVRQFIKPYDKRLALAHRGRSVGECVRFVVLDEIEVLHPTVPIVRPDEDAVAYGDDLGIGLPHRTGKRKVAVAIGRERD